MDNYKQYIGMTLNGKYQIEELLGSGGMSYVFKARVVGTDSIVSVKILNEESARDEKAVKRFVNESKAVAMLSHKNIVKIYDVAFESDIKYLVMEYVDGITLKEYINFKKTLEWGEAVFYVSQILKALGHAHSKEIIHRDVKPQNIMITRDGTVKVMDFGIAKLLKSESITMTDTALGTVDYISPEQASGKEVGFYSDIYSVGVMLYEMTTGTLPFIADSPMAVAMMQLQNDPTPPREIDPSLPKGLEQIIIKAMNKEPDCRFSSCGAMDKALELLRNDPAVIFADRSIPVGGKRVTRSGNKDQKRSSLIPIISGVTLAFFLVLAASGIYLGMKFMSNNTDVSTEIRIPDLVGKQLTDELLQQLQEDQFEITKKDAKQHDPEKKTGEIISQNEYPGTTKKLSSATSFCPITVTVNPPPATVIMGDYTNLLAQKVKNNLQNMGLKCEYKYESHDTIVEGYVIGTKPEKGVEITDKNKTVVTLRVSTGAKIPTTSMPQVVGIFKDDAMKALQEKNISIGKITYEQSDLAEGFVIKASVKEGETLAEKIDKVDLVISLGNPNAEKKEEQTEDPAEETVDESGTSEEQPENTPSSETEEDLQVENG
ncbi:MAG: PASTA domain-containing protein [Ruminococcaceae bacterium]|nr:PASTA domain-containing protein [Oscillospiraceae bacterium]